MVSNHESIVGHFLENFEDELTLYRRGVTQPRSLRRIARIEKQDNFVCCFLVSNMVDKIVDIPKSGIELRIVPVTIDITVNL